MFSFETFLFIILMKAENIIKKLNNEEYREQMKSDLAKVHDLLSQEKKKKKVAQIIAADI